MMTWLLLLLLYAAPQEARTVIVPKLIGMTVPVAEATLADAGLRLGKVTEVPDRTTPRGIVTGQGPYPGKRVVINYECELYVSKGPAPKD
jgi:beta-lactam-binding protein with PASTA domain